MNKYCLLLVCLSVLSTACKSDIDEKCISSLPFLTIDGTTIFDAPRSEIGKVYVIEGNICSIYNRGKKEFVLEIKPMSDKSHSTHIIPYGPDSDQMLLVSSSVSGSRILVQDIVQKKYTIVDILAPVENIHYKPEMIPLTLLTQEMVPIDKDKILYLNQGSFRSREPRFYYDVPNKKPHKISKNGQKSMNILDGTLLYNSSKNNVAFLSLYTPEIEIYDADSKSQKYKISIARDEDVEIVYIFSGTIKEYLFKNKVPLCFMTGASDDESLVAVYRDEKGLSYILLFDWEGNLHNGFMVKEEVCSVSLYDDYIYCWQRSGERDCLVQYHIHSI